MSDRQITKILKAGYYHNDNYGVIHKQLSNYRNKYLANCGPKKKFNFWIIVRKVSTLLEMQFPKAAS